MVETIGILMGATLLAVLKPTTAQVRRFERRTRPHRSGSR